MAPSAAVPLERPGMAPNARAFFSYITVWLRIGQAVTATLAAATALAGRPDRAPSWYSFFVFVAITSVLLDIGCLILYKVARQRMDPKYFTATYLPMAEMLLSFLWSVFWLAASVTFAAQLPLAKQLPGFSAGEASAAVAFGFVTFTLWLYTSVLAFIRFRNAPTYTDRRLFSSGGPTGIQQTDSAPAPGAGYGAA